MESEQGVQKWNAPGWIHPSLASTGIILPVSPKSMPIFGMLLLFGKKYSQLTTSTPGAQAGLVGIRHCPTLPWLCFLICDGYILYFGVFNKDLKNLEATLCASGDKAHLCFGSIGGHLIV